MADTAALREENAELRARLEARDAELAALREENAKLKEDVSEHESKIFIYSPLPWHRRAAETCRQSSSSRAARHTFR